MIDVSEARKIIRTQIRDFGIESIALNESMGRVLRESIFADRDLPPYDRVTMDGIAILTDAVDFSKSISIDGVAAAGASQMHLQNKGHCLEVMTGAILPKGCDAVIRYEDIEIKDNKARINTTVSKGQNIHTKGEDRQQGEQLIEAGKIISAAEIGVGASVGKSILNVSRLPKTIIISTGDELVEIDEAPLPYQIRKSNVYRIAASLRSIGIPVKTDHLDDDYDAIIALLEEYLDNYDLIILSGGVSKGKFDFLPKALEALGVEKLFHKITQRPGKPFWFGKKDHCTVFALPGNPVSSFMCTHIYLMDWLRRSLGVSEIRAMKAKLFSEVQFKPDLTYFLEVALAYDKAGTLSATPMKGNGSGDLANLLRADGFIELPKGQDIFRAGGVYPIHLYKNWI